MKTIYKNVANSFTALLLLCIPLGAIASENLEVFTEESSRVIHMKMNNPISESMNVFLINDRNRVIFHDKIGDFSTFEHSYDLNDAEDGIYTLVSEVAHMRYNRVLEVRGSEMKLTESYYTFKPVVKLDDNKVMVHYINNGKNDIGISIESGSETLFDSYYDNNEEIFSNAYAIDNLAKGSYTLHFATQGEFYSFEFEVD